MDYLLILGGLVLLLLGGEGLVRGSVAVASRLGMSPLVIGVTLVGFGTSAPELVTSVNAALAGAPGIAVGNVVGSNVSNLLLILGVTALVHPVECPTNVLRRDGLVMAVATLLTIAALLAGTVGRGVGGLLVGALVTYLAGTLYVARRSGRVELPEGAEVDADGRLSTQLLLAFGGIAGVVIGADLLVAGAISIAEQWGVPETVIGLTIVALGTSLPELAAGVAAAVRGHTDLAFGNVLGSNVFNLLGILGGTALVTPIPVDPAVMRVDVWVLLGATLLLLAFAWTRERIARLEGAICVLAYLGYMGWLGVGALGS